MHTVFAQTILYLLGTLGPLTTVQLHARIAGIHPDLCDNTVDRVIDGKRFGKKWKHAVRTAQQQLKKRGVIALEEDRWYANRSNLVLHPFVAAYAARAAMGWEFELPPTPPANTRSSRSLDRCPAVRHLRAVSGRPHGGARALPCRRVVSVC